MTVFLHELRRGRTAFWVWTASISLLLLTCMVLFPEMSGQMDGVTELFANMGGFTAAFGMDRVSFGDVMGFYAIECGNIVGLGGALYAALLGIEALAREEQGHTAEFLLTHPVSRARLVAEKLAAVLAQLLLMNALITLIAWLSFIMIGETPAMPDFALLHLAFTAMQLEIACICFAVSAFLRGGGMGIGIGTALLMYFLHILSNLSEQAEFLRYITPFAYADAASVLADGRIELPLLLLGMGYAVLGAAAAFRIYTKKDIAA
ncbi:MAG: ABC transporter permease subunit [Hominenteromicrobium sp.]